jgi:hypothetical protein
MYLTVYNIVAVVAAAVAIRIFEFHIPTYVFRAGFTRWNLIPGRGTKLVPTQQQPDGFCGPRNLLYNG